MFIKKCKEPLAKITKETFYVNFQANQFLTVNFNSFI